MNRPGILLAAWSVVACGVLGYLVLGAGLMVRDGESGKVVLAYDRVGGKLIVNGYVLERHHGFGRADTAQPVGRFRTTGAPRCFDGMGDTAVVPVQPQDTAVYAVLFALHGTPVRSRSLQHTASRLYWIDCDEFGDDARPIESDVRFILQCMKASRTVARNTGQNMLQDELAMRATNLKP